MDEAVKQPGESTQDRYLESYLDYYLNKSLPMPMHAVMVTGAYGVGKTHRIKRYFDAMASNSSGKSRQHISISLFGITTVEQIHTEVLAGVAPTHAKVRNFTTGLRDVITNMGGLISGLSALPDLLNLALLRRSINIDHVLIFDDIDRCAINHYELLGVFNDYVERQGCRVLLITHDEELDTEFLEQAEKVVGQSFRVEPQPGYAFDAFLKTAAAQDTRTIIESYRGRILGLFDQSGVQSLRILRQCIEDVSRLVSVLEPEVKNSRSAMDAIISLFGVVSLEVRKGTLSAIKQKASEERDGNGTVYDIVENGNFDKVTKESHWIRKLREQCDSTYRNFYVYDDVIEDSILVNALVYGHYSKEEFNRCARQSPYMLSWDKQPAWRALMEIDRLPVNQLQDAAERIEQEFNERSHLLIGEMLHTFAWRLSLAHIGWLDSTPDNIVEECKSYIDDVIILEEFQIPPIDSMSRLAEAFAHYAYFLFNEGREPFDEIKTYLNEQVNLTRSQLLKEDSADLLSLMVDDPKEFRSRLSRGSDFDGRYAESPILHHLDSSTFIEQLIAALLTHTDALLVCYALKERLNRNEQQLETERKWVESMLSEFEAHIESKSLKPLNRFKLKRKLQVIQSCSAEEGAK